VADSKDDGSVFVFLFFIALFWGGGYLAWKFFRPQITQGILTVRTYEMKVADLWMDDKDAVRVPVTKDYHRKKEYNMRMKDPKSVRYMNAEFGPWQKYVNEAKPREVENEQIRVMSFVALRPLKPLFAAIMLFLFGWAIVSGPTSRFRRVMGLENLMVIQAKTFKVIRPFLKFNPSKLPVRVTGSAVPVKLGLFAEALSPEEWIAVNELGMPDGSLNRAAAETALARQLGPRWKGYQDLPRELQVLLACFCMKASRKRVESDDMLGRLMCCWDAKGGLKLSRDRKLYRQAKRILRDKKLSERVLNNCNRHAYVSTALIRALNTAREEGGVLSPSQFLWLRGHNRALWYPLNNLGRQAFHIEALGACSHYRAEKQINRPIPRPRVVDGIDGLIDLMKDPVLSRPIPAVDYGPRGKPKNNNKTLASPEAA
jgi:intracellular multiplication protein IcmP